MSGSLVGFTFILSSVYSSTSDMAVTRHGWFKEKRTATEVWEEVRSSSQPTADSREFLNSLLSLHRRTFHHSLAQKVCVRPSNERTPGPVGPRSLAKLASLPYSHFSPPLHLNVNWERQHRHTILGSPRLLLPLLPLCRLTSFDTYSDSSIILFECIYAFGCI